MPITDGRGDRGQIVPYVAEFDSSESFLFSLISIRVFLFGVPEMRGRYITMLALASDHLLHSPANLRSSIPLSTIEQKTASGHADVAHVSYLPSILILSGFMLRLSGHSRCGRNNVGEGPAADALYADRPRQSWAQGATVGQIWI